MKLYNSDFIKRCIKETCSHQTFCFHEMLIDLAWKDESTNQKGPLRHKTPIFSSLALLSMGSLPDVPWVFAYFPVLLAASAAPPCSHLSVRSPLSHEMGPKEQPFLGAPWLQLQRCSEHVVHLGCVCGGARGAMAAHWQTFWELGQSFVQSMSGMFR